MGKFGKNATHRFFSQGWIGGHDLLDGHTSRKALQNERHGDARATHARATSKMLRISDDPLFHNTKLTPVNYVTQVVSAFVPDVSF